MAKAISRRTRTQKKNNSSLWIIGGVAAAAVLVLALVFLNLNATSTPMQSPSALNTGRVLGRADAPVTIDLYSDFQCPICRRAEQLIRQIAPAYIDTGKAKVVYHNFAFIGQESEWAAQAAECANEQGKFWEYSYILFDNQTGENVGAYSQANLKKFAADARLDTTAFNACFDSGKYVSLIQKEKAEAQARNIRATPSFYVNGQFIEGLLPASQFTALIDSYQPKQ
jgi:protein-disulfide isomerase